MLGLCSAGVRVMLDAPENAMWYEVLSFASRIELCSSRFAAYSQDKALHESTRS